MTLLQPTMLWESTDAQAALTQRFQFASVAAASDWLIKTISDIYGVRAVSVDRLVISSFNLLAWLTTTDGPLLAKCCAFVRAHDWLANVAELLAWLEQQQLPVSVPVATSTGERQVLRDHLSIGVQRIMPGSLLDPTQLEQAQAAGITLASLHHALAAYPRAIDFASQTPLSTLAENIQTWAATKAATRPDRALVAGRKALLQSLQRSTLPELASQVVHHDYRAANILWHADKITAVLDFEDLRWSYRVNDLAWAAVHLGTRFHHWGPVSEAVHANFLAAYTSLHPLTAAEQAWLPRLMVWHSINLANAAAGGIAFDAAVEAVVTYACRLEEQNLA